MLTWDRPGDSSSATSSTFQRCKTQIREAGLSTRLQKTCKFCKMNLRSALIVFRRGGLNPPALQLSNACLNRRLRRNVHGYLTAHSHIFNSVTMQSRFQIGFAICYMQEIGKLFNVVESISVNKLRDLIGQVCQHYEGAEAFAGT